MKPTTGQAPRYQKRKPTARFIAATAPRRMAKPNGLNERCGAIVIENIGLSIATSLSILFFRLHPGQNETIKKTQTRSNCRDISAVSASQPGTERGTRFDQFLHPSSRCRSFGASNRCRRQQGHAIAIPNRRYTGKDGGARGRGASGGDQIYRSLSHEGEKYHRAFKGAH